MGKLYAQHPVLDDYIQEGLRNNLTIKQQGFQLQKSMFALEEARGMFLPSIGFNASYVTAQGGRTIAFPVGDIINPLYYATGLAPVGSAPIPNVKEQLVPKNFYDTRIKTSLPILNAEIKYNRQIKQQQIGLVEADIQIIKRELVKDIKTAYFQYLKATEAISVYENSKKLILENQRVNQALVTNQMANPTVLVRSRNELGRLEADLSGARLAQQNAAAYLNFLLTRDLTIPVQADTTILTPTTDFTEPAHEREELRKLKTGLTLNETLLKLNQAYRIPKIGASLDLGSQGKISDVDLKQNPFWQIGLSVDIPIYAGNRNKLKVRQQQEEISSQQAQLEQVQRQLDLQVFTARNAVRSAQETYKSRELQAETARRYYRDIFRRYKENSATFIELLDAQTQITSAELQATIARYDIWLRLTELERATAAYSL
ncbi:MAG: TolC family protein [Siphonobacter sp.]